MLYRNDNNFFKTHIYSDNDLKIKSIEYLQEKTNFINLTCLRLFTYFYKKFIYQPPKKDINYERLIFHNTIIEIL